MCLSAYSAAQWWYQVYASILRAISYLSPLPCRATCMQRDWGFHRLSHTKIRTASIASKHCNLFANLNENLEIWKREGLRTIDLRGHSITQARTDGRAFIPQRTSCILLHCWVAIMKMMHIKDCQCAYQMSKGPNIDQTDEKARTQQKREHIGFKALTWNLHFYLKLWKKIFPKRPGLELSTVCRRFSGQCKCKTNGIHPSGSYPESKSRKFFLENQQNTELFICWTRLALKACLLPVD